jgi:hypothetical protein
MKKNRSLLLCVALLLAGWPAPGFAQPTEITGVSGTPDYPLRAAGFERGSIFNYGRKPDFRDVSVGYTMWTPTAQIVSTIYITEGAVFPGLLDEADSLAVLFAGYAAGIEEHHRADIEVLGKDRVTLTRDGRTYTALRAAYRFDTKFGGRTRRVYSIMMLWRHGDRFVKLRSTMPFEQRELSEPNNRALLDAVNWTTRPAG